MFRLSLKKVNVILKFVREEWKKKELFKLSLKNRLSFKIKVMYSNKFSFRNKVTNFQIYQTN